jgi:hypothetical protein
MCDEKGVGRCTSRRGVRASARRSIYIIASSSSSSSSSGHEL